jgi:hypothetical protein
MAARRPPTVKQETDMLSIIVLVGAVGTLGILALVHSSGVDDLVEWRRTEWRDRVRAEVDRTWLV